MVNIRLGLTGPQPTKEVQMTLTAVVLIIGMITLIGSPMALFNERLTYIFLWIAIINLFLSVINFL